MTGSSIPKIKNICVFGGSSPGKENEFLVSANHLGRVLAERKIHFVYGGGSLGLMGVFQ
jgi:predicted Rossmann-fold nucleotide-binding protein